MNAHTRINENKAAKVTAFATMTPLALMNAMSGMRVPCYHVVHQRDWLPDSLLDGGRFGPRNGLSCFQRRFFLLRSPHGTGHSHDVHLQKGRRPYEFSLEILGV